MLFGCLMLPSFISVITAAILAFFHFTCTEMPLAQEYSVGGHLLKGFLYLTIALGLPLAAFSTLSGALLTVAGFILKSWIRAFMAIVIGLSGMYFWFYFLNIEF